MESRKKDGRTRWWKVTHSLPYHGEDIVEVRYMQAETTEEVTDILKSHIHPNCVLFDLYSITIEVTDKPNEDDPIWTYATDKGEAIRNKLVAMALQWLEVFVTALSVASAVSEFDAARLIGCSFDDYVQSVHNNSAVTKGTTSYMTVSDIR